MKKMKKQEDLRVSSRGNTIDKQNIPGNIQKNI